MSSAVAVSDRCLHAFNQLKLGHERYKYVIFTVSDDNSEIVVEKTSGDTDYNAFLADLPKDDCRYAVYGFEYEQEGTRHMTLLYTWTPDAAPTKRKMSYASCTRVLQHCLGSTVEIQGTNYDEVSYESILEKIARL